MEFIDAAGIAIHVRRDVPTAGPPAASLVYLHSLGAELRIWDRVVAQLPRYDHLRVDLRGHGSSEVPAGDYTIAAMAGDVLAALEALRVERAVAVGISVGGQVALRMALAQPHRIAGVVALDTGARIGDASTWNGRIAEVRRGGVEAVADAVVARWFGPGFEARDPVAPRGYRQMLLRTPVAGYLGTCAALRDEDLTDLLADLPQPVLVLCGSHDTATPPELARNLARGLPRGRFAEIAEAAHLPCIDRPDDVARHLDAFVRELDRT
jgi:3-oxoadipate enol-lactonase